MNLVIRPGGMIDSVQVPSSKSYANRALILASLREEEILLRNMPHATDVTHLISALQQIGLSITQDKKSLRISGSFPECETKDQLISVGEGGTTARFLAVLLLKGKMKYSLKLGNRLKDRPRCQS